MKQNSICITALFFLLLTWSSLNATTIERPNAASPDIESVYDLGFEHLVTLERTDLEILINRKVTLSERLTLPLVKRKLKKISEEADSATLEELKNEGLAVAGLVVGIVGMFIWILSPVALILSIIGLRRIKKNPSKLKGRGMAIAGLVLGITGTVVLVTLASLIIAYLFG